MLRNWIEGIFLIYCTMGWVRVGGLKPEITQVACQKETITKVSEPIMGGGSCKCTINWILSFSKRNSPTSARHKKTRKKKCRIMERMQMRVHCLSKEARFDLFWEFLLRLHSLHCVQSHSFVSWTSIQTTQPFSTLPFPSHSYLNSNLRVVHFLLFFFLYFKGLDDDLICLGLNTRPSLCVCLFVQFQRHNFPLQVI